MYTPFIRSSKENPFPKKLNKLCPRERQTRPESIRMNYSKRSKATIDPCTPLSLSLSSFLFALAYFLPHVRSCTLVCVCVRVREFNARRTGRTMPCMDTMGIVRSESE